VAVARLRRALAAERTVDEPRLRTVGGGYLLAVADDELDASRFEAGVNRARRALESGDPQAAHDLLSDALALWRGPPLADVTYRDYARPEIARLDELRLVAVEARVEAQLRLGRHAEVVPELQALVARHPERESASAQLMLALYRSGRQTDALDVYRRTRAYLAGELGLEPGPALVELQAHVLTQAPELRSSVRATPAATSRGPLPPSVPLVGRASDVATVTGLVTGGTARVVTLLGPGGIGKTSLAIAVAHAASDAFEGRVAWVDLSDVREPDEVRVALVEALGERGRVGAVEQLRATLGDDPRLVVLDNFEHVLPAAATLGELLQSAAGLRLLVTSRAALELRDEQRYPVAPLGLPADTADSAEIGRAPAVMLFVERAQARAPSFQLTEDVQPAVTEICRRLDGLPLAIELAAARASTLSPLEILQRVRANAIDLASPHVDIADRHHSLRATLDWSVDLLADAERDAFERIAVFAGGATPDAAEAVLGCSLQTLERLVDHSMLARREERHGRTRLAMLQPVREYALERLSRRPDRDATYRRHAEHFAELGRTARRGIDGPQWLAWHDRLETETPNIRAAARWATAVGVGDLALALTRPLSIRLYEDDAALYDIAFDWDIEDELTWLVDRLGGQCRAVLEPGCGSGRIVEALARRGLEVVGVDRSAAMIDIARERLRSAGVNGDVVIADITDFDLGRRFDGAACPINTLGHLTPEGLAQHLERMADHLRPGARYLIQLDLRERASDALEDARTWEMARGDTRLRITVSGEDVDMVARRELQRVRIEVLSGDRAGDVVDEVHAMTIWTPADWLAVTSQSAFELRATYDGERAGRPRIETGSAGTLLWHELMRRPSVGSTLREGVDHVVVPAPADPGGA
jgi:predicted ATPase/DNA-binding SARP family transcriptional activator/SAM-dependent methyltransferase